MTAPARLGARAAFRLLLLGLVLAGLLAAPASYLRAGVLGQAERLWISAVVVASTLLVQAALLGALGALRSALRFALWPALFVAVVGYGASWFSFVRGGPFVSRAILDFLRNDPAHILILLTPTEQQHLVIACLLGVVAVALLARIAPPSGGRGLRALAELGLPLLALLLLFGLLPLMLEPQREARFRMAACYRSTPELALWCSLAAEPQPPAAAVSAPANEPIAPLAAYLSRIDDARASKASVVLLVVESLRADSLGQQPALMPFLEQLAARGSVFSNAFAQSDATDCAVPALLSSLYPLRAASHELRHAAGPKTLAWDLFGARGYRTGVFSSHNDLWGGIKAFLETPALDVYFHPEVYDGKTLVPQEDTGLLHWLKRGLLRKGSLDDRVTVERFLEWVGADPKRPFFAYLNFQVAHFPYQLAFDIETPFQPAAIDFEASFHEYPRSKAATMRNRYRNSLRFADARIRDVVAGLERLGRSDDTLLIVTGDHGQEFFEHGGVTHGKGLSAEVARVPLVFAGPGALAPRRVVATPLQHVDVLPTLLELLGLPPYPGFQGRSVLSGDLSDHRLFLVGQHAGRDYALVWRGFKYVDHSLDESLFDLAADPEERIDLSDRYPQTAAECRGVLAAFRRAQREYYGRAEAYERFYPPRYP